MTNNTAIKQQPLTLDISKEALADINETLEKMTAQERVAWALDNLPDTHIVSSSFGAQSAVMLHMLTQAQPDIPVVLTDTGRELETRYSRGNKRVLVRMQKKRIQDTNT